MTTNIDFVISEEKLNELIEKKKKLLSTLNELYNEVLKKYPDFQEFKNTKESLNNNIEQNLDEKSTIKNLKKEDLNKKLNIIINGIINDKLNVDDYYPLNKEGKREQKSLKKVAIFQNILNFSEILNKKEINEILKKENLNKEELAIYEEYVFYAEFIEDFYQDRADKKMFKNQSFFDLFK